MRQSLLWGVLVLLAVFAAAAGWAQQRGQQRILLPGTDQEVTRYTSSHALIIANNDYTAGWNDLPGVVKDLPEVQTALEAHGFIVEVARNLTRSQLLARLDKFVADHGTRREHQQNRLLFYVMSHGHTHSPAYGGTTGYIVPVDAPLPGDEGGFLGKAVSMEELMPLARRIQTRHTLFVFDSCFAGTIFSATQRAALPPAIERRMGEPVRQFITAGDADQTVPDDSVFRRQFVAGLGGDADLNRDGYITGSELGSFLDDQVSNFTRNAQTPRYGKLKDEHLSRGDVVFTVYRAPVAPPRPVSGPQLVSDRWEDLAAGKTWELPVLGNDRAASGGALRVVSVSGGAGARVEVKGDGSAVLVTAPSGMSEVRFRYRVRESGGGEGEAEVVVALAVPVGPLVPSGIEMVSGVYGQPGSVFRDRGVGLDMVVLPRGAYQRGSPDSGAAKDSERFDDEGPVRTVEIGYTLAVGRTEVTVGQYRRFVVATGRQHPGGCYVLTGSEWKLDSSRSWQSPGFAQGDDHPVSCVSWQDAQAYIGWLNGQLGGVQVASSGSGGGGYRLLSESEWDYAARGVTSAQAAYQRRYWGDSAEAGCGYANGADLSAKEQFSGWATSSCRDGFVYTAPVGSLKANAFGLHDMLGNVWEWTQDCYVDNYGGAPVDGTAASGPDSCPRVLRGGSWIDGPRVLRSAFRFGYSPGVRSDYLGFRLARMLSN